MTYLFKLWEAILGILDASGPRPTEQQGPEGQGKKTEEGEEQQEQEQGE